MPFTNKKYVVMGTNKDGSKWISGNKHIEEIDAEKEKDGWIGSTL